MRITFLGAAGMVTGSCYLLEAGGMRLLVDCGMFQGKEEDLNTAPFGFHPAGLDGVILTHAHIDHAGRLPLLHKQGFTGPIYTHQATADLARIMLQDSAYIQEMDAERENRKASRAGRQLVHPLYTQEDARAVVGQMRPVAYDELTHLGDAFAFRLQDAGHILGSALIECFDTGADGQVTKLVFSGDLGQPDRPILQDPAVIREADYLVMESTYGNKVHAPHQSTREALANIISSTINKGGNVVIPAFAVGRTQELLYELNILAESGKLPRNLQIVLDSPLAIAATEITANHMDVFDDSAKGRIRTGDDPFHFPGLTYSHSGEDSKALNVSKQPKVIIAASGMCEAGRVVHHLKHNLWRPVSTILFVGFQAEGTMGRRILEGAKRVKIHGEEVAVRARIESLEGLSAHADQEQLLDWVGGFERPPVQTFLVHGETEGRTELGKILTAQGHRAELPFLGQTVTLLPAPAAARTLRKRSPVKGPNRVVVAPEHSLAISSRRMSAIFKELRAIRKAWYSNGPHLPPERAEELTRQADELLRALDEMRRIIEHAGLVE